jgi:hypothetical protein
MKPSIESFFTVMSGDISQSPFASRVYSFTEHGGALDHSLGG